MLLWTVRYEVVPGGKSVVQGSWGSQGSGAVRRLDGDGGRGRADVVREW